MKTATKIGTAALALFLITALLAVTACGNKSDHGSHDHDHNGHSHEGDEHHSHDEAKTASHPDVKPAVEAGEPVYFCPMHPSVISAEQGQCDPCGGMRLVEHKGQVYGCPMHSDEVTTDIESDCRVCGMDLEELKKSEESAQTKPSI